jgi:hypothetical protein
VESKTRFPLSNSPYYWSAINHQTRFSLHLEFVPAHPSFVPGKDF